MTRLLALYQIELRKLKQQRQAAKVRVAVPLVTYSARHVRANALLEVRRFVELRNLAIAERYRSQKLITELRELRSRLLDRIARPK